MMETIYEKYKGEFAEFIKRLEVDFDKVFKETLESLSIRKSSLDAKITELEKTSKDLSSEIKKFSTELLDLNQKTKDASESLKSLDEKRLGLAEDVLAAEDIIKESKLKMDDLNKKDEDLQNREIAMGVKSENLREREARINTIMNKINK